MQNQTAVKSFYVDYDENGNEVRTPKGRGRTKLGYKSPVDDPNDENVKLYFVDPSFDREAYEQQKIANQRQPHFYINLDSNGNEVSRSPIGRGRPKVTDENGNVIYTKAEDGNYYRRLNDHSINSGEKNTSADELARQAAERANKAAQSAIENAINNQAGTLPNGQPAN